MTEVITSWVTLGALFGALAAGQLADQRGRRFALLLAAILFTAGAALEALAPGTGVLVVGRLVVGLRRRRRVGRRAALRGRARADEVARSLRLDLPARDHDRHLPRLPRRPGADERQRLAADARRVGRPRDPARDRDDADARHAALADEGRASRRRAAALAKVRPEVDADGASSTRSQRRTRLDGDEASWREVFSPALRKPLMVGIGLAIFQQITGINAIIYYADKIFAAAGFATPADQASATTWAIGGVNVLATFIAVAYVDRFGRRPLLLVRARRHGREPDHGRHRVPLARRRQPPARRDVQRLRRTTAGIITLVALVVFIASFAFSLGPGRVDGHQRDLPEPGPRPCGRGGDRGQLVLGVAREPVLPHPHRRHRHVGHVLAVRRSSR